MGIFLELDQEKTYGVFITTPKEAFLIKTDFFSISETVSFLFRKLKLNHLHHIFCDLEEIPDLIPMSIKLQKFIPSICRNISI